MTESRPRLLSRIKERREWCESKGFQRGMRKLRDDERVPIFIMVMTSQIYTHQTYRNVHYKYVVYCMPIIL